jgi:hypothetical protein
MISEICQNNNWGHGEQYVEGGGGGGGGTDWIKNCVCVKTSRVLGLSVALMKIRSYGSKALQIINLRGVSTNEN